MVTVIFASANTTNMWIGLQSKETEIRASPLKGRKR